MLLNEIILITASNLVFTHALGLETLFTASKKPKGLAVTSAVTAVFTIFGSMGAFAVNHLFGCEEKTWALLLYIALISLIYAAALSGAYLIRRNLFGKIKKYIHLSSFSTAVTGTILVLGSNAASAESFGFPDYLYGGIASAVGFIVVSLILGAASGKLDSSKVPRSFRGVPAMLVYLGIITMAVYSAVFM